jgi:type II secretion system protein I
MSFYDRCWSEQAVRQKSHCRLLQQMAVCRCGFTLLEVMIAMAILAISLVAVFHSQSQSISMASGSRFITTAALLAQSRMEEISGMDSRQTVNGEGDFGEDFPDYAWQVTVANLEELPLLRKIVLTVTNKRIAERNAFRLTLYKVILP